MPSMLDDWHRLEMEEAHPEYWEPAPRVRRPWQEIEAENAAFRRRTAQAMARLRELEAKKAKERDRED
jgi:hypothetical protein